MERRGVVEKSRGLQGGRTDERITPELSPVAPWLRASVETKSTNQAGWQAGRLVGQAQVQVRIQVQVSVCPGRSQAKAVVQLGAGWEVVGGWEIGMSELAGGQEAGRWQLEGFAVSAAVNSMRPKMQCRWVATCKASRLLEARSPVSALGSINAEMAGVP